MLSPISQEGALSPGEYRWSARSLSADSEVQLGLQVGLQGGSELGRAWSISQESQGHPCPCPADQRVWIDRLVQSTSMSSRTCRAPRWGRCVVFKMTQHRIIPHELMVVKMMLLATSLPAKLYQLFITSWSLPPNHGWRLSAQGHSPCTRTSGIFHLPPHTLVGAPETIQDVSPLSAGASPTWTPWTETGEGEEEYQCDVLRRNENGCQIAKANWYLPFRDSGVAFKARKRVGLHLGVEMVPAAIWSWAWLKHILSVSLASVSPSVQWVGGWIPPWYFKML